MENAVVLKNGRVIRTTAFDNTQLEFFNSGHLKSFVVNENQRQYHAMRNKTSGEPAGYWDIETVLQYNAKLIDRQQYLKAEFKEIYFEDAVENDIVFYEIRESVEPLFDQICFSRYEFEFSDQTILSDEKINLGQQVGGPNCSRIPFDSNGMAFFNTYRNGLDDPPLELLANIAQYINNIENEVYQDFYQDFISEFPFTNVGLAEYFDNYINEFPSYQDFLLSKRLNFLFDFENKLKIFYQKFRTEVILLNNAQGIEKKVQLALGMPHYNFYSLSVDDKIDMLDNLVDSGKLSSIEEKDLEERLVINLVHSFEPDNIIDIETFLDKLIETPYNDGNKIVSRYEMLYERMSTDWVITQLAQTFSNFLFETNFIPEDTKGGFAQAVYRLWLLSKYNPYTLEGIQKENSVGMKKLVDGQIFYELNSIDGNDDIVLSDQPPQPEATHYYTRYIAYKIEEIAQTNPLGTEYVDFVNTVVNPEAAPVSLNYNSEKGLGIFWDNYQFEFDRSFIIAKEELPYEVDQIGPIFDTYYTQFVQRGRYSLLQPVTLIDTSIDTKVPLPTTNGEPASPDGSNINSVIPIFFLKYIDDAGERSDVQNTIWLIIDIFLTFSGIGAVQKLAHLRHLSKFNQIRVIIESVEFSSGVLSFLANFADNCNSDFCKNIKAFLFWLELASLSGDGIFAVIARRRAKIATQNVGVLNTDTTEEAAQKIKEALGNTSEAEEVAFKILEFAADGGELLQRLARNVKRRYVERIDSNPRNIEKFDKDNFSDSDILEITEYGNEIDLSESEIANILFNLSKKKKIYNKTQTLRQMRYYKEVILRQGFPSGFSGDPQYIDFCITSRNTVENYLDEVFEEIGGVDYEDIVTQGSVLRKELDHPDRPAYPDGAPDDIEIPTRNDGSIDPPDDIEFGIRVNKTNFEKVLNKTIEIVEMQYKGEKRKEIITKLEKGRETGSILYKYFPKTSSGEKFEDVLRSQLTGKTLFEVKDVNFGLILKGGAFDNFPFMPFKYE